MRNEMDTFTVCSTEQATDTDSGSLRTLGGLAVKKDIQSGGNIHCFGVTTISDIKLKENVESLKDIEVNLDLYNFYKYNLKKDPQRTEYGVIAHDLEDIHPEMIYKNSNGMLSVDYRSLHSFLINDLIQKLKNSPTIAQMEDLKHEITYLRNEITDLKNLINGIYPSN